MKGLALLVVFTATVAAASDKPSIRICVGPLENHSKYSFDIGKAREHLLSYLPHKQIKAFDLPSGTDVADAITKNNCDYLLRGEFSDFVNLAPGQVANVGGIVVDEKKKFALRFDFDLRKGLDDKPVHQDRSVVIDKNPKTCADDNVWDAAMSVRKYFKDPS
jgi:hypothetical protein